MDASGSHTLSSLSIALNRDTFIFSATAPTRIVFGINQKVTPVSSDTIRRWKQFILSCPASWTEDSGFEYRESSKSAFYLQPVDMVPCGIMIYTIKPTGEPLPIDSKGLLPAGNYGFYLNKGTYASPAVMGIRTGILSLKELEELAIGALPEKDVEDTESLAVGRNEIVHILKQDAMRKCGGRCVFTGDDTDVVVSWIVPPDAAPFCTDLLPPVRSREWLPEMCAVQANLIVCRRDLSNHFLNNAFSFDPTDSHRTIIFKEVLGLQEALPKFLSLPDGLPVETKHFINLHFHFSIKCNLVNGDITDEYNGAVITEYMDELGIGMERENDDARVPLEDARWQTVLGKAIWEDMMRASLLAD